MPVCGFVGGLLLDVRPTSSSSSLSVRGRTGPQKNEFGLRRGMRQRTTGTGVRMSYDLAVLISGGGRSLENILTRIEDGRLPNVNVKCVVASKKSAGGLKHAESRGIPTRIISMKQFDSTKAFSNAITSTLDEFAVDLTVLAGWMHFYQIPEPHLGRVINIHPSLIPSFCGKGYYGHHVHKAVLEFGAKLTGCTVHFADNEYDHGPIVLQRAVTVEEEDDTDTLAARVFEEEKRALPEAIKLLSEGRVRIDGRRVRVMSAARDNHVAT